MGGGAPAGCGLARFLLGEAHRTILLSFYLSADLYAVEAAGGKMTFGTIEAAENQRKTSSTFNFDQHSRTLIAAAQMAGDGLILTLLSYISFRFVIYPHHVTGYMEYFPYFCSTIGTTIIMIISFALCGSYDIFDEFRSIEILRSTIKCVVTVILLLTACLFIFKVSDNVSRLWLGTWSLTSAIGVCGFRLLTAFGAHRLRQSGRLAKNVAVVGASEVGQLLAAKFRQESPGTRLVGVFDERQSRFVQGGGGTKSTNSRRSMNSYAEDVSTRS